MINSENSDLIQSRKQKLMAMVGIPILDTDLQKQFLTGLTKTPISSFSSLTAKPISASVSPVICYPQSEAGDSEMDQDAKRSVPETVPTMPNFDEQKTAPAITTSTRFGLIWRWLLML